MNDIIVYVTEDNFALHSGVVSSVDSSGNIMIKSKWGQGGVYLHGILNVPIEYLIIQGSSVMAKCYLFRYHNYESVYTGNNYHKGKTHYFEYTNRCAVCGVSSGTTWEMVPCSGPPCVNPTPFSLENESE